MGTFYEVGAQGADRDYSEDFNTRDNDLLTEDNFEYADYNNSLSNRLKQGWIVIQVCIMTMYMTIGIYNYNKLQKKWSKVKSLFVLQTVIIVYLAVNEFTHRHITGIFIILLFTQYSLFLTLCMVMDSCLTGRDAAKANVAGQLCFNKGFRICMHLATVGLFISTFFMQDCHTTIYPVNFLCVVIIVLIHQVYDVYLYCVDYMVDWDNLPLMSDNRLRYNVPLFRAQTKMLLWANVWFGALSILTVSSGYFIINRQQKPDTHQHLLCVNGNEWIYLSPVGNVFGTLHQVLILTQITITQYVMVRIPRNMGLFDEQTTEAKVHKLGLGLRERLLTQVNKDLSQSDTQATLTEGGDQEKKPAVSLNPLLALKTRINEANADDDDNFKA